ncbi:Zn-dependent alcohol dehydrogenase [Halieaceae bacterium IMCC14734]|uniref:Zn-dependent alcohol dehydrogenase n=1 Tax=Candidatus Litorirhabdus singularis TaxID=2518993 RepID=A0ABT3TAI3_9GAMM|nr:Zn-dependent alcohol dehydrogenase [Candidatus Litorirhabdus singularis]MCX2979255.1 Zn-dependent alcohol dehydrogenase [Candidatus Litorirhabdus singularis]
MRAAVLENPGQPLKIYDDVDIIEPRTGEVRVNVKYCGLCHSDLSIANGTMPTGENPIILGHEAAGIVDSVGPGVTNLKPGDHVVLTPTPPCGQCYYCQRNQHSLCVNSMNIMTNTLADGTTGLSRNGATLMRGLGVGALAEYVITPATGAIKVDNDVPLETVCVIGCALQTGVGAVLNTAEVEAGATVLVMGAGGIGISTIQGAVLAGAAMIVVSDPVAERRAAALEFGATHAFDPISEDLVARCFELTGGIGMDYAFETAGVAALIEQGINATRMGGKIVCVGAPPVEDPISIPSAVIFAISEKKLCGCLLGSSNSLHEIPRLIRLWKAGKLNLEDMITARRPLSEVNEGLADLAAGKGIRTVLEI